MRILLGILLLALAAGAQDPFKLRVNRAVDRGCAWLLDRQGVSGRIGSRAGEHALSVLALLHGGISRADPRVKRALAWLKKRRLGATYDLAARLLVLKALRDPRLEDVAWKDGLELASNQARDGGWSYAQSDDSWDNSNTQYAILGLEAASGLGVEFRQETWQRAARHVLHTMGSDGGGVYRTNGRSTMNMTLGALAAVIILAPHVEQDDHLKRRLERARRRLLAWAERRWHVPGSKGHTHYGLYGLERAMAFAERRQLGRHDWYHEGARWLIKKQRKDGAWESIAYRTAFAILFLRRATLRGRTTPGFTGATTPTPLTVLLGRIGPQSSAGELERLASKIAERGVAGCRPLLNHLESDRRDLRTVAVLALRKATGSSHGYDPELPPARNARPIRDWIVDVLKRL